MRRKAWRWLGCFLLCVGWGGVFLACDALPKQEEALCSDDSGCPSGFFCKEGFCWRAATTSTVQPSFECEPGTERPCYHGEPARREVGLCKSGVEKCTPEGEWSALCEGQILPENESCDGKDNDCDGLIDNAPQESLCATGTICEEGRCQCHQRTCQGGCCSADGLCLHDRDEQCGESCKRCERGQRCSGGRCICDEKSCPTGCCDGDLCKAGHENHACGKGGVACRECRRDLPCEASTGVCGCSQHTCPEGCCDPTSGECKKNGNILEYCGAKGNACFACVAERADQCFVSEGDAACRCGHSPACGEGQRCEGGRCVCDAKSCKGGCCDGNRCVLPASQDAQACGEVGKACAACPEGKANRCVQGVCRCGQNPPCTDESFCQAGVCRCDPLMIQSFRIQANGRGLSLSAGKLAVSPGQSISITLEYKISGQGSCSGCTHNVFFGIAQPGYGTQSLGSGCLYSGQPEMCPRATTRTHTTTVTVPEVIGEYDLFAYNHIGNVGCFDAKRRFDGLFRYQFSSNAKKLFVLDVQKPSACQADRLWVESPRLSAAGAQRLRPNEITVLPSTRIQVEADLTMGRASICLNCARSVAVSIGSRFSPDGCLYRGTPAACGGSNKSTRSETLTAPQSTGSYLMYYDFDEARLLSGGLGCHLQFGYARGRVMGVLHVVNQMPP